MAKEYQVVVRGRNALPQDQEIELAIRDLSQGPRKYDGRYVKAIVSSSPDKLPGGDILWLISSTGYIYPDRWAIRIVKEVGPYPSE